MAELGLTGISLPHWPCSTSNLFSEKDGAGYQRNGGFARRFLIFQCIYVVFLQPEAISSLISYSLGALNAFQEITTWEACINYALILLIFIALQAAAFENLKQEITLLNLYRTGK